MPVDNKPRALSMMDLFSNDPGGGSDWTVKEDSAVACRVEVLQNFPCDGDRVRWRRTSVSLILIK